MRSSSGQPSGTGLLQNFKSMDSYQPGTEPATEVHHRMQAGCCDILMFTTFDAMICHQGQRTAQLTWLQGTNCTGQSICLTAPGSFKP